MSRNKYFVQHDGTNMGPFEIEMICTKVAAGELAPHDSIYLESSDEWVPLSKHPEVMSVLENPQNDGQEARPSMGNPVEMPVAQVENRTEANQSAAQWYVLKGKNRYGPFVYGDVIKMLQEKSIFEFDYVWCNAMETWKRIAELSDFSPDNIRNLLEKNQKTVAQIFHRRRFRRFDYECSVIAHDNAQVWKGKTVELSEGGAGVVMENAMLLPGQNVYLHFKPGDNSKPFNVLCEIVSKKFDQTVKDKDAEIVYGVKFINIHKLDRDEIKTIQVAV